MQTRSIPKSILGICGAVPSFFLLWLLSSSPCAAVIGGAPLSASDFNSRTPWLVKVTAAGGGVEETGVMVAPQWVLTAGHSLLFGPFTQVQIGHPDSPQVQSYNVVQTIRHPLFKDHQWIYYDAVLLRIDGTYAGPFPKLATWLTTWQTEPPDATLANVAGWGYIQVNPDVSSQVPHSGTVEISERNRFWIITQPAPGDIAPGDSGGPLFMIGNDGSASLLGIASASPNGHSQDGFAPNSFPASYFTRIGTIRDWILLIADGRPPITVPNPIPNQNAHYFWTFSYTFPTNTFADPTPTEPLIYAASGLPVGLDFNPVTRTISGEPFESGTFNVALTASDSDSPPRQATCNFTITVAKAAMMVSAHSASRLQGQANPSLSGTVQMIFGGDHFVSPQGIAGAMESEGLSVTYSCLANAASPPGSYSVVPIVNDPLGYGTNYNITLNNGQLTVTLPAAPACMQSPSNLVAWWRGENNALDSRDNNHGATQGNVGYDAGKVGSAFSFDGTSGLVALGTNSPFRQSSAITYSFWTRIPSGGGGPAMGAGASLGHGYGGVSVFHSALIFSWTPGSPGSDTFIVSDGATIPTNQWVHVTVAMDFANQTRAMYINGQPVNTTLSQIPSNWTPIPGYNSGQPDFLGGRFVNSPSYFNGDLDEVDVYNRSLSASEVAAVYQAGSAGKCLLLPPCTPSPSGLVSWWQAEGNALDSVGPNHGTLQNGATFSPARIGQAFSFDGVNDYIRVPHNTSLNLSTFTLETWVRTDQPTNTYGTIWSKNPTYYSYGDTFALGIDISGRGWGRVGNGVALDPTLVTAVSINDNQWHHLALTYDGANLKLFLDGVEQDSAAVSFPLIQNTDDAVIGQWSYLSQTIPVHNFKGLIEDLGLYNRALTANEIATIHSAGATGKCAAPPLAISPSAASIAPSNTVRFSAVGGQPPYTFFIATNNSGGSINPTNGIYVAGPTLDVNDTITVTDNLGATATASVHVESCTLNLSGMLGWWRGENNATDSKGANHGTLRNGATFASGLIGAALQFDGVDDYVEIPSVATVQPRQALTIEGWVYAQGTPNTQAGIAGTWDDLNGDLRTYLFWVWAGNLELLISGDGGGFPRATDPGIFPINQWVHVAGTYDGDTISVYRNGTLVGSSVYSGGIAANNHPLFIGRTDSGSNGPDYWKGGIDELSLYDRALSAAEINAIYQNGAAGKCLSGALVLTPSLSSISPTGTVQFIASAGQPPYTFSLVGATNHGTINPVTGFYTATNHCGFSDTIRVTDSASRTANAVVNIVDGAPPAIFCPSNMTVIADGSGQAAVPDFPADAVETDDCGIPTVRQTPFAGSFVGLGIHTIRLTATDGGGESTYCELTLTVLPQPVFDISGQITNSPSGTPLVGVTVTLSYNANGHRTQKSTVTDASGNYNFAGIPAEARGTWLPQSTTHVFTPVRRSFDDLQANRVGDFGAATALSISGRVIDANGLGVGGVTMKLSGTRNTKVTTSAGGNYAFTGLPAGTYQITPTNNAFQFTPATTEFASLNANATTNFVAAPSNSPNGRIAYSIPVSPDKPFVFGRTAVMNADGTQRALLGKPGQRHTDQAWSPDGSRLALVRNSRVVVMNADGSGERVVSGIDLICFSPTWSPDGLKIAFGAYNTKVPGIYIVNTDGTRGQRLPVSDPLPLQVSWAHDGTRIAFTRLPSGNQIWTVQPDGTGLTAIPFTFNSRFGKPGRLRQPVWSPTGNQFAFVEPNSVEAYFGSSTGGPAQLAWPGAFMAMLEPGWSPDGGSFSFFAPKPIGSVMLMETNGSNMRALTAGLASQHGWGRQIARTIGAGTNVAASMGAVSVSFSNVTSAGATVINPIAPDALPLPAGFFTIGGTVGYEISTAATVNGPITLTFVVPQVNNPNRFAQLRVLHGETNGTGRFVMVDRTLLAPNSPAPNFATRTISARVNSLSPFAIAELDDTNSVQISGLVVDTNGLPVEGVTIQLGGDDLASLTTAPDGSFAFPNLATNGGYTITPQVAGLVFDPPSVTLANPLATDTVLFVAESEAPLPLPSLKLEFDERFGGQPALVWAGAPSDFELVSSPSLSAPDWQPVSEPPLEMGVESVLPIVAADEQRFYRLRNR